MQNRPAGRSKIYFLCVPTENDVAHSFLGRFHSFLDEWIPTIFGPIFDAVSSPKTKIRNGGAASIISVLRRMCFYAMKSLCASVSKNACADGAEHGGAEHAHASSLQ